MYGKNTMHAEGGRSRWTLKILPCFRPEEDLIERLREKKSSEEKEISKTGQLCAIASDPTSDATVP